MKNILNAAKEFICYLIDEYFPFIDYINKGKEIVNDVNKTECLCGFELPIEEKFRLYRHKILTVLSIILLTAIITSWLDPLVSAFSSVSDFPVIMKLLLSFWVSKTTVELLDTVF